MSLLRALNVYDGSESPAIPISMGCRAPGQLAGTPLENLCELAGRICYDSLGSGRPSFTTEGTQGYHEHILEVGHLSVYEHANVCIELDQSFTHAHLGDILVLLMNRPGVVVSCGHRYGTRSEDSWSVRVSYNPRVVADWHTLQFTHPTKRPGQRREVERALVRALLSGLLLPMPNVHARLSDWMALNIPGLSWAGMSPLVRNVPPWGPEVQWITLYLSGSRGFSHEQVRHGDFTAISQRSTRYVDESKSPCVLHPLMRNLDGQHLVRLASLEVYARQQYIEVASALTALLKNAGVDATTARKQARGAARGLLGNSLHTEMLFSATVCQWQHMLRMRGSRHADAEIRCLYAGGGGVPEGGDVLSQLQASACAEYFECFRRFPAPDGLGFTVVDDENPDGRA